MTAYLRDDGMAPDPMATPRHVLPLGAPPRSTALELQLSINQALMKRLDALEKRVKELEHRQPV